MDDASTCFNKNRHASTTVTTEFTIVWPKHKIFVKLKIFSSSTAVVTYKTRLEAVTLTKKQKADLEVAEMRDGGFYLG